MVTSSDAVSTDRKDATAITVMRCMLLTYAEEKGTSFEQALQEFAQSRTYGALFDFDAGVWKEGPDYLRWLYDEELAKT